MNTLSSGTNMTNQQKWKLGLIGFAFLMALAFMPGPADAQDPDLGLPQQPEVAESAPEVAKPTLRSKMEPNQIAAALKMLIDGYQFKMMDGDIEKFCVMTEEFSQFGTKSVCWEADLLPLSPYPDVEGGEPGTDKSASIPGNLKTSDANPYADMNADQLQALLDENARKTKAINLKIEEVKARIALLNAEIASKKQRIESINEELEESRIQMIENSI